jgi:hypothetical protein
VQDKHDQQNDARGPDQLGIGLQEMPVTIDCFFTEKDLQVAGEMADDEEEHQEPGKGHYVFFA